MTDGHTSRLESALAGLYKIERKLGEGGKVSVYLAEDIKHEGKVALKILRPELAHVIGAERFLTYDLATGATQQLTFEGENLQPVWSPDGSRIAFSSRRGGVEVIDILNWLERLEAQLGGN